MILSWDIGAWEDYLFWSKVDKSNVKRINALIKETLRTPFEGIGKPEPLKGNLSGYWSRRITQEHRMVYRVYENGIHIIQCRFYY